MTGRHEVGQGAADFRDGRSMCRTADAALHVGWRDWSSCPHCGILVTRCHSAPTDRHPMAEDLQRQARFIQDISDDLASGSVSFPTYIDATLKIRELVDDPAMTADRLARAVGAEALLSAKLIRLANSAALNPGGPPVTDVRAAIIRVGFAHVRTLVWAVAMDQLRQARELGEFRDTARQLWEHSLNVAAIAYVLTKKLTRLNPDAALYAGMVHDIGLFYLLSRVPEYPELLDARDELSALMFDLHEGVAHAILESLGTPEEVIRAVDDHEMFGDGFPPESLSDVLFIANQMATAANPFSIVDEYSKQVMRDAATFGWDRNVVAAVIAESDAEMRSVMTALGA